MNHQLRLRMEVAIVRHLLRAAAEHGFRPKSVFDGDRNERTRTHNDVMRLVFNLDDSIIYFQRREGDETTNWVKIICGTGIECISDYSDDGGDFTKVLDDVIKTMESGLITFSPAPCTNDIPAWENSAGRGVCINCGCKHRR